MVVGWILVVLRLELSWGYENTIMNQQAQICAEGCEEDNITHFFRIKYKHKLCTLIDKTQL